MLSSLWDGAYQRVAYVVAVGFLSRYLNGPLLMSWVVQGIIILLIIHEIKTTKQKQNNSEINFSIDDLTNKANKIPCQKYKLNLKNVPCVSQTSTQTAVS